MKNSFKLMLAGTALVVGLSLSAAHAKTLDVVKDSNGTPIRTESGDCLRSHWDSDTDNCKNTPSLGRETVSVYFNFGSSVLTPATTRSLDVLIAEIKGTGATLGVRVAGFADRIGSATANERLSKKRADKVRRYLLAKGVANAQVVETRWFGDSVAATKCPEGLSKKELIKCLQPDRRVDIEIDYISDAK